MIGIICRIATFAVFFVAVALGSASAQDQQGQQRNQPGQFDFYVLALSWSPSFCQANAEQGRQAKDIYVYFKHEETGVGPQFAKQLMEILGPQAARSSDM